MRQFQACLLFFAFAFLAACGSAPSTTVTSVPSGGPLSQVNDSLYVHVLARALSPNGAVSLSELRADTELTLYLGQIARMRTDVFVSRESALAFWINAHNAYVLDLLRSNPGVRTTDDISDYRYAKVVLTGGTRDRAGPVQYSLDDIEHTILTEQFRDPRAFFGLWDGTRSSPPLCAEPYAESQIGSQLDEQLTHFLADSTKNMLDRHANTLYLSERFHDYRDNLEKVSGSLAAFIRAFAPHTMAAWIDGHPSLQISYLIADHTINTSDLQPSHPAGDARTSTPARRPPHRATGGIQ